MVALANIRDEPLSFENYGEYATSATGTSPIRELLSVLAWLGPHARATLPEPAAMRAQPGRLSKKLLAELDRTVAAIREGSPGRRSNRCLLHPAPQARPTIVDFPRTRRYADRRLDFFRRSTRDARPVPGIVRRKSLDRRFLLHTL